MNRTLTIVLALGTLSYSPMNAADNHVGSLQSFLQNANDDVSTPASNSSVKVGGCTGTLITPTIVLTAGHCFDGVRTLPVGTPRYPHPCSDWQNPTQWYPFDGGITFAVTIGNDSQNPLSTYQANSYSLPGCVDIIMLRLTTAVPASQAIPAAVATRINGNSLADQQLQVVGWGSSGLEDLWKRDAATRNSGWSVIGHANLVTGMAESNGNLFAATEGNNLWVRPASDDNVPWQKIGHANGVVALAAVGDKLFAATRRNNLWVRGTEPVDANWLKIGHANGITAMTSINNKLFAATNSNRIVVRDPVLEEVAWRNIGHANGIVAMAAAGGRIYGAQDTGTLWSRAPTESDVDWVNEGSADRIRAMTASGNDLFASNRPEPGEFPQNSRRYRQSGLGSFGNTPCGSGSTTERRAQFCFASDRVRTLPGDSGGPIYWLRPGRTRVLVGVARQTDDNGGNYVATFFNRTMNGPDSFNVGLWIEQVANPTILP